MKGLSVYERSVYKQLKKLYPNQVIAPGKLRLESTLSNSSNTIQVPVLEDSIQPLKTEVRLNKNDLFFMIGLGMFITRQETGKEGRAVLTTYPNEFVFPAVAGFKPSDLEALYNGKISMKVGDREYISTLDTNRFRFVPETQQSGATNKDEFSEDNNFSELPTHYKLRGTDQIDLSVVFPSFNGIEIESVTAGFKHQLVLVPKGFIIKNGANLNPKTEGRRAVK
jgi:hypothetical protein